jgi:hypothetical protein
MVVMDVQQLEKRNISLFDDLLDEMEEDDEILY